MAGWLSARRYAVSYRCRPRHRQTRSVNRAVIIIVNVGPGFNSWHILQATLLDS